MTLNEVKLIEFPKVLDERGNLSFFENNSQIPFEIARTYWIYDVPGGQQRGGHAFKSLQEVIVALSGSFDIVLHDGKEQKTFTLNRSYYGLYVPRMIWRHIDNFSTNSLALIVASEPYNQDDYLRDFQEFNEMKKNVSHSI